MKTREMPLDRLLSKAFLRPHELPEAEAARIVLTGHGKLRGTRFANLRLGLSTWQSAGCGELPKGLDYPLRYWVMPWQSKIRPPMSLREWVERRLRFRKTVSDFRKLVRMMDRKGWVGPAVPGILLVDGKRECFLFTDGNRRIGIAAAVHIAKIPAKISPLLTFDWKATKAAGWRGFSEADTRRIWEHVWRRVHGECKDGGT